MAGSAAMNFIIFTLYFLLSSLVPPTASKNCSGTIPRDNVNSKGSKGAFWNGYNHCEQIRSHCWGNSRCSAPRVRASLQFSVNYPESGASSSLLIPPEVKPITAVNQELCCASHLLCLDLGCMIGELAPLCTGEAENCVLVWWANSTACYHPMGILCWHCLTLNSTACRHPMGIPWLAPPPIVISFE